MGVRADPFSVSQLAPSSSLSLSFPAMSAIKCDSSLLPHTKVPLQGGWHWLWLAAHLKALALKGNTVVYGCRIIVFTFSDGKLFPNRAAIKPLCQVFSPTDVRTRTLFEPASSSKMQKVFGPLQSAGEDKPQACRWSTGAIARWHQKLLTPSHSCTQQIQLQNTAL